MHWSRIAIWILGLFGLTFNNYNYKSKRTWMKLARVQPGSFKSTSELLLAMRFSTSSWIAVSKPGLALIDALPHVTSCSSVIPLLLTGFVGDRENFHQPHCRTRLYCGGLYGITCVQLWSPKKKPKDNIPDRKILFSCSQLKGYYGFGRAKQCNIMHLWSSM